MQFTPLSAPRCAAGCRGFSLLELLISLAILLVLFTMMYGFGSRQNQLNQRQRCQSNLLKIYIGLQIYAQEHAEQFPAVSNAVTAEGALAPLVPRYTADTALYVCPGSKDSALAPGISLRQGRVSYAYYMGWRTGDAEQVLITDKQVNTNAKPAGQPLFSADGKKPGNNHHKYGGNLVFTDGSVRTSPASAAFPVLYPTNIVLLNPKP